MKLGPFTTVGAVVHVGVYCVLLLLMIGTSNHVKACTLDGCDHPDCGSCGNACCSLLITVNESTEAVMHKLNQSITEEGGPDELYIPMMTAGGTMTFSDLRQYGAGADFLGQALHTTLNGKYNDTINFSLSPTTVRANKKNKQKKKKGTIISAFSISDIAGAYCDSGQNYWNLLQLIEGIAWENDEMPLIEHDGESCPTTTTNANSKTPPARVHKHKQEKEEETNNDDGSSEEEEPEDTSFSSEEEEDTVSSSSSSEEDTIPETTTADEEDADDGSTENIFNALSKNMDTTTTDDPLLRPLSMGKHFLLVVVGMVFLVSGSYAVVLMRKKKQQEQRTSAAHSTSSFRENYGRL